MEFLLGLGVGTSLGATIGVLVVAWLRTLKDEGRRHDYAKPDQPALVDVWDSRDDSHIPVDERK